MHDSELDALVQLLDDPDLGIYEQIRTRLISFGEDVIPSLENAWEHSSFGLLVQNRIEEIIHSIQFNSIETSLSDWAQKGGTDLLEGASYVAKYQYPDMDSDHLHEIIDQLVQDVWIELNDNLTALEKVKIINHILFDVHRFSGNTSNFHAPQNSYMNIVLESKKGNPLSLSILYSIVAQRLDLPIYGVNLPKHFVLAYVDPLSVMTGKSPQESEILFYINPFSKGSVISKKEIQFFLKQLDIPSDPKFFTPTDNIAIVARIFNNLTDSYTRLGYPDKVKEISLLSKSLGREQNDPED